MILVLKIKDLVHTHTHSSSFGKGVYTATQAKMVKCPPLFRKALPYMHCRKSEHASNARMGNEILTRPLKESGNCLQKLAVYAGSSKKLNSKSSTSIKCNPFHADHSEKKMHLMPNTISQEDIASLLVGRKLAGSEYIRLNWAHPVFPRLQIGHSGRTA